MRLFNPAMACVTVLASQGAAAQEVRVTKADLGPWARQLRTWGFTVPDMYARMP